MHIRGTIVILFAVTLLILASSAPMAQTPTKWESVLKWREVETKDQEKETAKAVRRIVEQIIEPADKPKDASWKRSAPSKACELEFRALQALALMQALPFLAEGGEVSDRKLFESAKALSRTAVNKVLEDSLPEYWETVKEMATAKEGDPYDPSSAWTVREKLYTDRAYSIPVLLMCLEYYFAGGLEIAYEKGRHRTDRPARPSFRPIGRAELGIARLTALLLMPGVSSVAGEDKYSTQVFDVPLKGGAIWQYRLLGAAPDLSCCHKSGFAMMGLRAALNLGLLEFDEKAFKFPFDGKAPLGQERFRNRLADVLTHCVLTILSVPNELTDAKNSIGVTGFESYKRLDASRTEKVPAISDGSRSIDLSKYRALYGSNAGGRRILSVEYAESLPGLPTDTPREAAYRYLPGDGFRFGTYHTASAAYILATAANALPLLLPSDGGAVGKQYTITSSGKDKWSVKVDGGSHEISLDPSRPFSPIVVDSKSVGERVTQCLNFVVRLMSSGGPKGERMLDRTKAEKAGCETWEAVLSLEPGGHQALNRGICCFGILKLGLAVGQPDVFGPWPYYRDFCACHGRREVFRGERRQLLGAQRVRDSCPYPIVPAAIRQGFTEKVMRSWFDHDPTESNMIFQMPPDGEIRNEAFRNLLGESSSQLSDMRDELALIFLTFFAGYRDKASVNHILLEGLNGTAKTTLVKVVTNVLLGDRLRRFYQLTGWDRYVRVAGSPDQTPSDLTGFDAPGFDEATGRQRLVFTPGPLLHEKLVWYCDELNRSPPKTQAVWLEPMAEGGQITVTTNDRDWRFRRTVRLTEFFLIASQNPETQEGTFPLPEAMLDRFIVKITMRYTRQLARLIHSGEPSPSRPLSEVRRASLANELVQLLTDCQFHETFEKLKAAAQAAERPSLLALDSVGEPGTIQSVLSRPIDSEESYALASSLERLLLQVRQAELGAFKEEVRAVKFSEEVAAYIERLVYDTWSKKGYAQAVGGSEEEVPIDIDPALETRVADVVQGASPRAAIAMRDLALSLAWALNGANTTVTHEHAERVAHAVLRHRVSLSFQSAMKGVTSDRVVRGIVSDRKAWVEDRFGRIRKGRLP